MKQIWIAALALAVCAFTSCSHGAGKKETKSSDTEAAKVVAKEGVTKGRVWVRKADGSKSCGMREGMTPEQAAAELKKAGVKVFGQKAGQDGLMHMMVCGANTGSTVEVLIDGEQYSVAEKLGYQIKPKN